jgi:uncharacterized Rmd1/YagE family protein
LIFIYSTHPLDQTEFPTPPRPLGELFFFDYGVVVIWGLTELQERRLLSLLAPYEEEALERDQQETEEFRYQYRAFSQPRIFNDIITLRLVLVSVMTEFIIVHRLRQWIRLGSTVTRRVSVNRPHKHKMK